MDSQRVRVFCFGDLASLQKLTFVTKDTMQKLTIDDVAWLICLGGKMINRGLGMRYCKHHFSGTFRKVSIRCEPLAGAAMRTIRGLEAPSKALRILLAGRVLSLAHRV